jgi:hypothetical protein
MLRIWRAACAVGSDAEDTRRSLDRLELSVAGLRADVTAQVGGLRSEFGGSRSEVASEIRDVRSAGRAQFLWMLGIMLTGFSSLLGLYAHGFHWIP